MRELVRKIRVEPDATTGIYLVTAIRHKLEKADRACPITESKKRFALLEWARDNSKKLRERHDGESFWWSLAFAGTCVALLIAAYFKLAKETYYFHYPENYLRIIQNPDPCLPDGTCGLRRVVQRVTDGVAADPAMMRFCDPPRFEAGHTLAWIRYTDFGSCVGIDGFDVVRGPDQRATLADGCKPDYSISKIEGHVSCPGGRAKF